jgi:uncharacterized membrane protein YjjB (DUF3815 family)
MNEWIDIGLKSLGCAVAALGFGVLFNAPPRALAAVALGGCSAGLAKYSLMWLFDWNGEVIVASFSASVVVGLLSIWVAHLRHVPPNIFSIPSVIPLVPGVYAYRTMLGLIRLAGEVSPEYASVLSDTVHSAVITFFVIIAIALGVAVPMHLMRQESVKNIRLWSAGQRKRDDYPG